MGMLKFFICTAMIAVAILVLACQPPAFFGGKPAIALLPEPVSNNAVARIGDTAYSFAGLHEGKSWRDVTADATACNLAKGVCHALPPLPDGLGRLAASAVAMGGRIYIFGGYSVARDGAEKSTPQVWVFDPQTEAYRRAPDMPVPVDDSLALGFAGRYIVLVSGWHATDNVALVQVLDTQQKRWFRASDFPGAPVFGHAGAVSGNHLLLCGGVKVAPPQSPGKRRSFVLSKSCWQGVISKGARRIDWSALPGNPPGAAYRRAAVALPGGRIGFYGGALNPYNYDGIGYDGAPSVPLARLDIASLHKSGAVTWQTMPAPAGMDYRGALIWHGALVTLGGMGPGQKIDNVAQAVPVAGAER